LSGPGSRMSLFTCPPPTLSSSYSPVATEYRTSGTLWHPPPLAVAVVKESNRHARTRERVVGVLRGSGRREETAPLRSGGWGEGPHAGERLAATMAANKTNEAMEAARILAPSGRCSARATCVVRHTGRLPVGRERDMVGVRESHGVKSGEMFSRVRLGGAEVGKGRKDVQEGGISAFRETGECVYPWGRRGCGSVQCERVV